ncbi:ABC transporter substrate-binding protein [Pseudochelatococcus sp. B33]
MAWQKAVSLLAAALMALALGTGAAPAQEKKKLVFLGAGSVPNIVYMPVYVADKAGFFAEEGIEVETRYGRGGPLTVQVVAAGDADVAHIVWQPLISAYEKGVRGRFIYQTFTRSSFFAAVEPDSPIKDAKDLAGRNIGVVNMASPGVFFARSMVKSAGADPASMTFVPVNVGAQPLAALETGQVDALSFWDAVYADYEAQGVKLRYIQHPLIGDVGNGGFFAMDNTIAEKKQELQAFTRAIAKATVFILNNPEEALRMYWQVNPDGKLPGSEAEALEKGTIALKFVSHSWDISKRPAQEYGYINKDEIQSFIDLLHQEGELANTVDAANLLTNEFVEGANNFDIEEMQTRAVNWKE